MTIYELFELLVRNTPIIEEQKREAEAAIQEWKNTRLFGDLAETLKGKQHKYKPQGNYSNVCGICGKGMEYHNE